MEKKSKNNVLVIVISLLLIVIVGLVGYICYDKEIIFSKGKNEEVKETNVEKENVKGDWKDISLNDSRFYSLYENLKGFTYDRSRGAGYEDFNRIELASLAYGTAQVNKDDFTVISTDEKTGGIKATFNPDIVKDQIKEIFNKDVTIDYDRIKEINFYSISTNYGLKVSDNYVKGCGFTIDSYDKTSNKLTVDFIDGCGGTSGPSAVITPRKIISAKEKDDTIVVKEKAIYYDVNYYDDANHVSMVTYNIYGDSTKNNYLADVNSTTDDIGNVTISVDSYLDQASIITHVYKLNPKTNKYYFVQSTIS